MAFHLFFIFVLVNLAFGESHDTITTKEELYWISVFSHTPMPKVLRQILPTPGQSINVTKLGADWYGKNRGDFNPEIGIFDGYSLFNGYSLFTYSVDQPKTKHINPTNQVNRKALGGKSNHEISTISETIFFFEENLLPRTKVNLPKFLRQSNMATFLPQQIADSMSLSNENLPQILKNFSLKVESKGASKVRATVESCDRSVTKGETKYCATSLESLVDFGVSVLGKHVKLLSHELVKNINNSIFTIGQGVQKMGANNIIWHKMNYPYAVYMCHSIEKTQVYKVPLVSEDGKKAKAIAVCHKDTSAWSPDHIAFKLLQVKPGTVPICHFLARDTLVWIPY